MADTLQLVATPPIVPPRISLLVTAPIVDDDVRWLLGDGIVFKPQNYTAGYRDRIICQRIDPTFSTLVSTDFIDATPFVVLAGEKGGPFGAPLAERRQRLADQLAAVESYEIANELWAGGNIDSGTTTQRILTSVASDDLTTSAVAPDLALGLIEQGLAQLGKGQRGMIHMTPQVLTALVTNGSVRRDGNVYLSPMDHYIVADAGYPGTGPAGHPNRTTASWIYGTSMIRIFLGTVILQGIDEDGTVDPGFFDPSVNDIRALAVRPALIQWDEQVHVAAQTNLTLPLIAGAS